MVVGKCKRSCVGLYALPLAAIYKGLNIAFQLRLCRIFQTLVRNELVFPAYNRKGWPLHRGGIIIYERRSEFISPLEANQIVNPTIRLSQSNKKPPTL
jgi:hypothetical protein